VNTDTRHVLLICTVGGTPEPLVKALLHWRPDRVVFVPSEQTCAQVDAVLRGYAEAAGTPLNPGQYVIRHVPDAEDLLTCVRMIRGLDCEVTDWLSRNAGDHRVTVDFTAGTKCMTAALALVSRRWRCQYSYVGGAQRTKGGVGIVKTGAERVVYSANPWDAFGYQAIEDAVIVFNHGGYAAAAALLDAAVRNAEKPEIKRELSTLKAVIDAYTTWDRFEHKSAIAHFNNALKNRNDLSAIFAQAQSLINRIERHRDRVEKLVEQKVPTTAWVEDLLRNAERRAAEHRFDDAVARLYRAFEALAQVRLREQYEVRDTKAVPLSSLPDRLRQEWSSRARNGNVFLGLRDAYRLLRELGDDIGTRFAEAGFDDDQRLPLVARNQSILAHGFQSASQTVYDQLHAGLCRLAQFDHGGGDGWRLPSPGQQIVEKRSGPSQSIPSSEKLA
jgi:CRISPR-associated protein (TIGR02710 family)